jgi:hypothetical protein
VSRILSFKIKPRFINRYHQLLIKPKQRERERERDGKDRLRVDSKRKSRGEARDTLFSEGGKRATFC